MSHTLTLGPLSFRTIGDTLTETLGDGLETVGAAIVSADPNPKPFSLNNIPVGYFGEDSKADGQRARRQVRALLQNAQARMQGLYFNWTIDPELNGWLVVGGGTLTDPSDPGTGITLGEWMLTLTDCYILGRPRTHRASRLVQILDRRLSTTDRDFLRRMHGTDFAALGTLSRVAADVGATDLTTFGSPTAVSTVSTRDGNLVAVTGATDGQVISYELADVDRGLADVHVWDRQGQPTTESAWEELFGLDQPCTAGDMPVLDNGRCRVRYDSAHTPGFAIDVWTGAAWVEQGKVIIFRLGDLNVGDDTFVSAFLAEWTPERAVVKVVLRYSADTRSREQIFITLQRGWSGPRIEVYPAAASFGACGASIRFYPAVAASDDSAVKIDASNLGAVVGAVAGSFPNVNVGAGSFTGENEVALLRQGQPYSVMLAAIQSGARCAVWNDSAAYGVIRNFIQIAASLAGYTSVHFGFTPQVSDQIIEAESFRSLTGTAFQVTDALAWGGLAVGDGQTATPANNTCTKASSNLPQAKYRAFLRVRVDAGATGSFTVLLGTATANGTSAATAWTWIDLGDILAPSANPSISVRAWRSAGSSGSAYVDRVALVKVEDRTQATPAYDGARDLGQSALLDLRAIPTLVERS